MKNDDDITIELNIAEIVVIRDALREYRTTAPSHAIGDEKKLKRWRKYRDLFEEDKISVSDKITDILGNMYDKKPL